MSNKTQLQTNNAELSALIQTLQGKSVPGGGSGAQTYETCTVNLSCTDDYTNIMLIAVLCFENGSVVQKTGYVSSSYSEEGLLSQNTKFVSVNNVICGSNVLVIPHSYDMTLMCRNVVGLSQSWVSDFAAVLDT